MASNPMQKKSRNSFLLGMLLMLIIAAIAMVGMYILLKTDKKEEEEEQVKQKQVYVVSNTIASGAGITEDDLKVVTVNEDTIPSDAYGPNDLGYLYRTVVNNQNEQEEVPMYKAKIQLTAGTVLSESMIYEGEALQASERVQEFNMLQLPVQLEMGEFVDVRLLMSNGQDYIVVSHKEVLDITDSTIWLQLSEDEILLMSNAIVESYISPATNLYVTKYVEPGMQSAAQITYIPSNEVINLINQDPNIVQTARDNLVNKYTNSAALRGHIETELGNFADQSIDNIQEKMQEARDKAIEARQEYLYGVE